MNDAADRLVWPVPKVGGDAVEPLGVSGLRLPVELFNEIVPNLSARYLIKRLLMAETATVIFGAPGCGKSFLALDMALHIAAGRPWFDRPTTAGGVVYLAAEGQGGLRLRVEAWKREHPDADAAFALIPTPVNLLDPRADLDKVREALCWLANEWGGIALLVVDTLAATFGGGDENGADMAAYVANVARLCAPYQCARIFVTHAPLTGDAQRPRGHGSLWGAVDTSLHVLGEADSPVRHVHVRKQKDGDPGPDIFFKLKPVDIGTDADGDPVSSCVVEAAEMTSGLATQRKLSPTQDIVLAALGRTLESKGVCPSSDIPDTLLNRARTMKVVRLSEWLSDAASVMRDPDKHPDTPRRKFARAKEQLQDFGIIGVWEDWAWLNF